MQFEKRPELNGQNILLEKPLTAFVYENLIVKYHNLYYLDGTLLKASSKYIGNPQDKIPQIADGTESIDPDMLSQRHPVPRGEYVWLGLFQEHFGHFLVGTLARLWDTSQFHDDVKIVYVGWLSPTELFQISHISFCFSALGIKESNLYQASQGSYFDAIRVPEPAFVENYSIAKEYGNILKAVGSAFRPATRSFDGLVYMSKEHVKTGIRIVTNEADFTECLRAYGVTILFPEELSFEKQLVLWSGLTGIVTGFTGSAFHTAAFTSGKRICSICPHGLGPSNQVLLDRIARNETVAAVPVDMLTFVPDVPGFQESLRIADPQRMADLFLSFVEAQWGTAG